MLLKEVKSRWRILLFTMLALFMYMGVIYVRMQERGEIRKVELLFLCFIGVLFLTLFFSMTNPGKHCLQEYVLPLAGKIIEKRYQVCGLLFLVLVIFQVNGSSINMLDAYTGETAEDGNNSILLIGSPRPIRSDEWVVNTEYHIAQVNSEQYFPVKNENIGMDGQNMLLACNSPVFHISLIGKPQTWGYFLLGESRGLSWFWWFRFFALLLGTFETGQILTDKNRKLSVFLMFVVGFSPMMTWWYSSSIIDLTIAGQWLFVSFFHFLFQKGNRKKIKFAFIFIMSAVAYCIVLYPAIQVPMGYLLLIMMIYYLIHKRKEIVWNKKTSILAAASSVAVIVVLLFFLKDTYQDIQIVLNTAYPGKREAVTGNMSIDALFYYLISCILPFKEITFMNNCEVSMYLLFLPAVVLIFFGCFWKREKKDSQRGLAAALLLYSGFLLSMYVISYPAFFLKITLLSYTTVMRNVAVIGLGISYGIVLMLTCLPEERHVLDGRICAVFGVVTFCFYLEMMIKFKAQEYLPMKVLCLCCFVFVLFEQMLLKNQQRDIILAAFVTVVVTSLCVNPLTMTANSLTNSEFIQAAEEINEEKEGNWLVLDTMVEQNMLAANGIRTINALQYEPNLTYWKKLDTSGKYEDIYNRYAHVIVELKKKGKTTFKTKQDWIKVKLSEGDLKKAEVDYIVSKGELKSKKLERIRQCEKGGYQIYRVKDE